MPSILFQALDCFAIEHAPMLLEMLDVMPEVAVLVAAHRLSLSCRADHGWPREWAGEGA